LLAHPKQTDSARYDYEQHLRGTLVWRRRDGRAAGTQPADLPTERPSQLQLVVRCHIFVYRPALRQSCIIKSHHENATRTYNNSFPIRSRSMPDSRLDIPGQGARGGGIHVRQQEQRTNILCCFACATSAARFVVHLALLRTDATDAIGGLSRNSRK
jgi:hypothetical protein